MTFPFNESISTMKEKENMPLKNETNGSFFGKEKKTENSSFAETATTTAHVKLFLSKFFCSFYGKKQWNVFFRNKDQFLEFQRMSRLIPTGVPTGIWTLDGLFVTFVCWGAQYAALLSCSRTLVFLPLD